MVTYQPFPGVCGALVNLPHVPLPGVWGTVVNFLACAQGPSIMVISPSVPVFWWGVFSDVRVFDWLITQTCIKTYDVC